jgi:hypothetical protein
MQTEILLRVINIEERSLVVAVFAQVHRAKLFGLWSAKDCIEFYLFKDH